MTQDKKKELRKEIKKRFSENLSDNKKKSELICKKIVSLEEYAQSDIIFAYMALEDEVDLSGVIKKSFEDNKKIAIPKITDDYQNMEFYFINENEYLLLKNGKYGILEPLDTNPVDFLNKKSLFLVPGRAFTKNGKRLGRGKGFYDKYFSSQNLMNVIKIGICFDFQIFDDVPVDKNDILMDKIIFA